MNLGIFGRITRSTDLASLASFFLFLTERGIGYRIHRDYAESLAQHAPFDALPHLLESRFEAIASRQDFRFLLSIGGDGTMLDAVRLVGPSAIPIVGVNVGRLGFLANVNQHLLEQVTLDLQEGAFRTEERSLLTIDSHPVPLFAGSNFAFNEVTVHKSNSNEMIIIHAYINGEFLNSYWADGLIVSTPTGSTAYSLACGGPIIAPQAASWVITPIAPHSLTVRPVVIPDTAVVSFELESRSGQALIALDNRNELVQDSIEIAVRKAEFCAHLVKLPAYSYFSTLRDRLNWGVDSRN